MAQDRILEGIFLRITDETKGEKTEKVPSGAVDPVGTGASSMPEKIDKRPKGEKESTSPTEAQKAVKSINDKIIGQLVISPLNNATGGAAGPAYAIIKAAASGASLAMPLVGAAFWAVTLLQQKTEENKAKAALANELDNALIRNGSKTFVTHTTGALFGVKSTIRR